MLFVSIIFLSTFIPLVHSLPPTLKLTFTPDDHYFTNGHNVEIHCELLNPIQAEDTAQLWHVDFRTGKRTPVSRQLVHHAGSDAPETFRRSTQNPRHVEFIKKNQIRINNLQLEDSAQYECTCPDCQQPLDDVKKSLQVMKLVDPQWHIEPAGLIQENAKTTIRCTVNDFYPYVAHKIIHNHHEMVVEHKLSKSEDSVFPQKFSWEAVVTPTGEWHNTTLRCTVTEGNTERHALKNFEVLFAPRFVKCDEKQYVNSTIEKATIECSYAGNPAPTLEWFHFTDEKPVKAGPGTGITIETIDEHHGRYKSILTFEREKLATIPMTTTTTTTTSMTTTLKMVNDKSETTTKPPVIADNYYQQILNDGFIVKVMLGGQAKETKKIHTVTDANEVRSKVVNNSSTTAIQYLSTSIILSSLLTILCMIQFH